MCSTIVILIPNVLGFHLLTELSIVLGDGYVRQMWGYIWGELLKAVSTEPEPDVKVLLMESCARVSSLTDNCFY